MVSDIQLHLIMLHQLLEINVDFLVAWLPSPNSSDCAADYEDDDWSDLARPGLFHTGSVGAENWEKNIVFAVWRFSFFFCVKVQILPVVHMFFLKTRLVFPTEVGNR